MAAHEWTVNLPDGTEYVIESERDLTPDEINAEVSNIQQQHSDTGQSVTASAANAAGRGFIGGGGSLVEGLGDVAALVPGLENNAFQDAGQSVKDFGDESFPVNPANADKFAVKAGQVIGGVAEQALEFATGAKLLGTIGQVGRAGQLATASMFGKGADSGQDMAVQYGVDDDPWKKAAFTLGGGIIEAGTERLGGFAAESAFARRFGIGGIDGAPATGLSGYAGAVAMEGGEEMAANTANNTLTNILVSPDEAAAAGQRRPGYLEGNLEAGALGAIGGGVMALPLLGATPATPLPPPAGFTAPPVQSPLGSTPPPVIAPTGRASAVRPPTPAARPMPLTEADLASLMGPPQVIGPQRRDSNIRPKDSNEPSFTGSEPLTEEQLAASRDLAALRNEPLPPVQDVPPARVAIVAGAIATSPTPAVEADVIQTAQIAAALNAQKTSQPPQTAQAPAALPVPVVPGQPPAPEADPVAPGAMVRFTITDDAGTASKTAGTVTAINEDGIASIQTSDGIFTAPVSGLKVFGALPKPTAEQAATAAKTAAEDALNQRTSKRRFVADPVAFPLVTAIVQAGVSPRNPAAQLTTALANQRAFLTSKQQTIQKKNGGYDDLPKIKDYPGRPKAQDAIRRMFRNGSGNTPDVALQQAAEFAGLDDTEFFGGTAWQEIKDELMNLDEPPAQDMDGDPRMDMMERQAIEFYAAIEDGEFRIDTASLEPGDVLIVEGEEIRVKVVNRDKDGNIRSIELQDGKRFGRQEIDPTTALFVEEFQEDPTDATPEVSALAQNGNDIQPSNNQEVPIKVENGGTNAPTAANNATVAGTPGAPYAEQVEPPAPGYQPPAEPDEDYFEAMAAGTVAQWEANQAAYQVAFAAWLDGIPQNKAILFRSQAGYREYYVALTRDPNGGWRTTNYSGILQMPTGHAEFKTRLEAAQSVARFQRIEKFPFTIKAGEFHPQRTPNLILSESGKAPRQVRFGGYMKGGERAQVLDEANGNQDWMEVSADDLALPAIPPANPEPAPEVTAAQLDAEYLAAVEAGDTAKQQAMVDTAAKKAGFDSSDTVWHSSQFGEFSEFYPWSHFGTKEAAERVWETWKKDVFNDLYPGVKPVHSLRKFYLKKDGVKKITEDTQPVSTEEWKYAVEQAYPGQPVAPVYYYNNTGEGGKSWIITDPKVVKSSDPITRDESGNVIPLSIRFQTITLPTPAPEVTADGQRDMLAGRDDEPFNLTAESAKERSNREEKERNEQNNAQTKEAGASRKAAEEATPELPLGAVERAEQWADKTIAENRGQLLSGIPDPNLLAAYAVKGSLLIARGIRDFAAWSRAMIDEFGEAIRPHLSKLFTDANANGGEPLTAIPTDNPPISNTAQPEEKPPTVFEEFFGTEKEVAIKEREAQSAIRAALEVPLFEGIIDGQQPGKPLEETIASLSAEQRNALHNKIIGEIGILLGDDAAAIAWADDLQAYIKGIPELSNGANDSTPDLQFTNLVTAASILSGNYGQTGAFSMIVGTPREAFKLARQSRIGNTTASARQLASQSGIGSRMASLSGAVVQQHTDGMKRMGFTDADLAKMAAAFNDRIFTANEMEEIFAGATTSPEGFRVATALAKLQKYTDAAAAVAKSRTPKTEAEKAADRAKKLAKSILSDAVGPLVAKLPVASIAKAFLNAPAHLRNSGAWRALQITNWLTNNGIDDALAAQLTVTIDEIIARVLANVIYQQQEKFIIRQKGVGNQADLAKFATKFTENQDAILKAIEMGLMTDGTPWQAWFSSVTGIPAMTARDLAQVAAWENILTDPSYFNSEKGVAAAKLREFLDTKFGKDATVFEILAASYDAAALSSGTTFFIQYSSPIGRFIGAVAQDLMASLAKPSSAKDVADSVMAALEAYTTELPLAFKYDSGGNFQGDSTVKIGQVAVLKRDLVQQRAIWSNKNLPMGKRLVAAARWTRSTQDFLRQAMNAADSAAVNAFTRYFETREVARIMRLNNISKKEVRDIMNGLGNTAGNAAAEAEARGYTGALRRSYINDAMWARWKDAVAAHKNTPEAHRREMANLLEDATAEADFQSFVGDKRDTGGIIGLPDFLLGQLQEIGENRFRNARKLVQDGKAAEGSIRRIFWRSIFGFVGVPLNAARASLWYSPLGILNWINWKANGSSFDPKTNPYARSLGSALQVQQRKKELITGNAMLLIGIALIKGMLDDEDEWKLNGNGPDPSKHPDEAKAWARLHTKFSIEHTSPDGSQVVIPFKRGMLEYLKTPLMMMAGASDAQMNAKLSGQPEASMEAITWGIMQRVGLSSITTGMRNVAGAQGALQRGMSDDKFGSQAAFTAGPIIPYAGMLRWTATWAHPEELEQGFLNGLPMAVYWNDAKPALNSFGQTLKPTPSMGELTSNQTNGLIPGYIRQQTEEDRKLYGWIEKTGIRPTVYSKAVVEKRLLQALTDEQWWNYTKASGKVRYDQMLAAIDGEMDLPRTIAIPRGPDIKTKSRMKQGLADIDPTNKQAMNEAEEILEDIGQAAHAAGLEAINAEEPAKEKPSKKKAAPIY